MSGYSALFNSVQLGGPAHPSVRWQQPGSGAQSGREAPSWGAVTQAGTVCSLLACGSMESSSTHSSFFSTQALSYQRTAFLTGREQPSLALSAVLWRLGIGGRGWPGMMTGSPPESMKSRRQHFGSKHTWAELQRSMKTTSYFLPASLLTPAA